MDRAPIIGLRGGVEMPMLGLGVYQSAPGRETEEAVLHALRAGYRHIDTAAFYRNESDVGKALRRSGVPRKDVLVTTKLANPDHGFDAALRAFDASVARLGFDVIDLYLIHWPVARLRRDSWRALVRLLEEGRCRAIGVSNYTIRHLEELLRESPVVPSVNQVEFSPFLHQRDLLSYCERQGVQLEAYSPLTQGERLGHPTIVRMAERYDRTSAQVMLRWAIQHRVVVIPKSVRPARIEENARIFDFEISKEDMAVLDRLDENLRVCWDPTRAP